MKHLNAKQLFTLFNLYHLNNMGPEDNPTEMLNVTYLIEMGLVIENSGDMATGFTVTGKGLLHLNTLLRVPLPEERLIDGLEVKRMEDSE